MQTLRRTLNRDGFHRVKIVAADSLFVSNNIIVQDLLHDAELYKAVDIIGYDLDFVWNLSDHFDSLKHVVL